MSRRVALYCRVSKNDGQDINRQVNELKQIVDNYGWKLCDIYSDEGFSRTTTTRPDLDRMMRDSFSRRWDTLMTLELSRLGTSLKHMIEVVETLKQRNIKLFIVNQQIDTESPVGMMFFSILTSIQNYERELLSQRVRSGLDNAIRKGKTLGRPKTEITDELKSQILDLRGKGLGWKKIAKICKVGRSTIMQV